MVVSAATYEILTRLRPNGVAALVEECERLGIGVVGPLDEEFPAQLGSIPDPPTVLFYRGDLSLTSASRAVAIVGTRDPTEWGRRVTATVADGFARAGWIVVSGLAPGVDTVAHERSLEQRAPTVAVLGAGLARVSSAEQEVLARRIVESGGLLLAEVPPTTPETLSARVRRDRLQSGLAALTVICQAELTSGAMHTARYAVEQGRPLYVVALPRGDEPRGERDDGTQALLNEPISRLATLLPAWRAPSSHALGVPTPPARALDEEQLARFTSGQPARDPA